MTRLYSLTPLHLMLATPAFEVCLSDGGDRHRHRCAHLVSVERLIRKSHISRAVSHRPALLLGCQAVALVLRTLGILAGLAVAVQAILVHPVSREVL